MRIVTLYRLRWMGERPEEHRPVITAKSKGSVTGYGAREAICVGVPDDWGLHGQPGDEKLGHLEDYTRRLHCDMDGGDIKAECSATCSTVALPIVQPAPIPEPSFDVWTYRQGGLGDLLTCKPISEGVRIGVHGPDFGVLVEAHGNTIWLYKLKDRRDTVSANRKRGCLIATITDGALALVPPEHKDLPA